MCLISRIVWWGFQIDSFWLKMEVFYRPECTQWGWGRRWAGTWKWIFSVFKFRNECYKQVDHKQVDEKIGIICLAPMFPTWVMVPNVYKKVHCLCLSRKSVKAIYIYPPFRSSYALSENGYCLLCFDTLFWRG